MNNLIAAGICLLAAGCAAPLALVNPQPVDFGRRNPCNDIDPVQRALPEYPARAADAGQPGWVALEYDVTPEGTPASVHVIDASPPGVFDAAAIAALEQWRYRAGDAAHGGCRLLQTFRPPDRE